MDKQKKLNIIIWIVIGCLIFGAVEINDTKSQIKDLLDLDAVVVQHNEGISLSLEPQTQYITKEKFARVELLQTKLMTELCCLFFGLMVLLSLLDKKEFSLIESIKGLNNGNI